MTHEPKNLKRWTMPQHYFGAVWPAYYSSGVGQSRDSDTLEESNFATMLKLLGGESETVTVVRENHWMVGWVEWIAIHQDDERALKIADEAKGRLDNYPVLDENDWSEREYEKAATFWDGLSPREKVRMAMDERERRHWTRTDPVWRFGRMDYDKLCNDGSFVAEGLVESLRE